MSNEYMVDAPPSPDPTGGEPTTLPATPSPETTSTIAPREYLPQTGTSDIPWVASGLAIGLLLIGMMVMLVLRRHRA